MSASAPAAHGADAFCAESSGADTGETLARLRTFHTLDALRGVAAVAIVLYHAAFFYGTTPPAEGQIAVDLFFVMSGFIVAHRYGDDLRGGMALTQFVKLRLIRLYPLFFLGMLLGVVPAVAAVLTEHRDAFHVGLVESFPLAVLMLPSRFALPRIHEIYPLNYVAWSLALELVVNVAYAATVRFWTIRRLGCLLAAGLVGLGICAVAFGSLRGGYNWSSIPVGVVRVVYGFGAGVLLCRLFERRPFRIRVPWWVLVGAACLLFVIHPPVGQALWELVAIAALVPALVAAAVVNEPPQALRAACALAGVYSYAVYSLHAPFVGLFLRGETRAHLDIRTQTPLEALVFTILLLALCVLAHLFYDKPVRRILTAWSRARPPNGRPFAPIGAQSR